MDYSAANRTTTRVDDTIFMWEAIESTPRTDRQSILVRAFTGGDKSCQRDPFYISFCQCRDEVLRKYGVNLMYENMDTKTLCKKRWNPNQLMNWLLSSNVHFITAHAHQGLRSHGISWDMEDYLQQLQRLKFHVGFPSGEQLSCPVFTQNKFQYLRHLGDMANNTFILPLTPYGEYDAARSEDIKR